MKTKIEKRVEKIYWWKDGDRYAVQICYNIGSAIVRRVDKFEEVKKIAKEYGIEAEKAE